MSDEQKTTFNTGGSIDVVKTGADAFTITCDNGAASVITIAATKAEIEALAANFKVAAE